MALVALAAPAFAATVNIDATDGSTIGSAVFKPSKSVIVSVQTALTTYSAGSKHAAGNKGFATNNQESKLTELDCAAGTTTKVTIPDAVAVATACE